MMEVAVKALQTLYPNAVILKKQGSEAKVICSVLLVSMAGEPVNYKVWTKEHGIERHYTDTRHSDAKTIQESAEEAVKAAASIRNQDKNKEYEYYSRLLST